MGVIRSLRTNLEASGATKYKGAMVRAAAATSRFAGAAGGATAAMGGLNAAAGAAAGGIAALAGGAAIGAAVKSFADFDEAMTKSQAIMGELSDKTMARMNTQALNVSTTMVQSAEEAAESYFFLSSAGLDAQQSIKALPVVARFAQAGLFNMSEATELLTDAQSALGLSVDDATQNMKNMQRVSDVLVKANTMANATVRQFAQALTNRAAPAMRSMNIELEEGISVLAAFADQGMKGRRAGTQFARILRILSQSAAENTEAFKQLGIIDAEGNLRNMATVVKVLEAELEGMSDTTKSARLEALGFTARVQAAIKPLIGMSDEVARYQRQAEAARATTKAISGRQMQTLNKQLALVGDNFAAVAKVVGEVFEPVVRGAAHAINTLFGGVRDLKNAVRGASFAFLRSIFGAGTATRILQQSKAMEDMADSSQTLNAMVTDIVSPFESINTSSMELPSIWDSVSSLLGDSADQANRLKNVLSEVQRLRIRFRDEPFLMPGVGPSELKKRSMGRMGLAATAAMAGRGGVRMPRATQGTGLPSSSQVKNTEGLSDALKNLGINSKETWQALTNDLLPALTQLGSRFGGVAAKIANFASQTLSSVAKIISSSALSFTGAGGLATLGAGLISGLAGFFQHGGRIPSGQFGVVGEAGPEIVQGPATVSPGGMTLQVDASGLPEPQTPFEVARDRQWLRLLSESNDVLRVNKGGL